MGQGYRHFIIRVSVIEGSSWKTNLKVVGNCKVQTISIKEIFEMESNMEMALKELKNFSMLGNSKMERETVKEY